MAAGRGLPLLLLLAQISARQPPHSLDELPTCSAGGERGKYGGLQIEAQIHTGEEILMLQWEATQAWLRAGLPG